MDRTVRVWTVGRAEPALTINRADLPTTSAATPSGSQSPQNAGFGSGLSGGAGTSSESVAYTSGLAYAQFYHRDRLLLLSNGPEIVLCGYNLAATAADKATAVTHGDAQPHLPKGRYRCAHRFRMEGSPALTALAACNARVGSRVLCAGARAIELHDLNGGGGDGGCILRIDAAHERAIHALVVPDLPSVPVEDDDICISISVDNCLKIWDVRDTASAQRSQCAQLWCDHTNRVHAVGAALSPCGRFVACGSEDRQVYLYDLRKASGSGGTGLALAKMSGHSDAVLAVAFSPVHPQLATAGADGRLLFFADKA